MSRATHGALVLMLAVLAGLLFRAVLELPVAPGGLTAEVEEAMPLSGVEHPVTAVLLNFRSYDTWLEIGVLLLAMLGVLAVQRQNGLRRMEIPAPADSVLAWLIRFLAPMMVLVAGYLLWLGKFGPGGAFQAGVVLGALGVLMWLGGQRTVGALSPFALRVLLLPGFVAFLIAAVATVPAGEPMLRYPTDWAGVLILAIEAGAAVSIGVTLAALFVGLQPVWGQEAEDEGDS
jgi:multisubunit Na+/H+ antiporter MnhB subunit